MKCIEAKSKQDTGIGGSSREPAIEMKEQKQTMKGKKAANTVQVYKVRMKNRMMNARQRKVAIAKGTDIPRTNVGSYIQN
jgi:hypothetical protein